MPKTNVREQMKKVDYWGLVFDTLAIVLVLIPLSESGHGMPWSDPKTIAMLVTGGVCAILFLISEWRFATLPMMPLSIFTNPSVAVMLLQSFLMGACYYPYLTYLPLYYENVHGYSVVTSAVLLKPLVITQSIFSILSGLYVSSFGRYREVIWFGFGIWMVGSGLLLICNATTSEATISVILAMISCGVGCVFQPSLVAFQAQCPKSQRAVVTSKCNFLRSLGGAVGSSASNNIMGNVLKSSLPPTMHDSAASPFARPDLASYNASDRQIIASAYATASRSVFIWSVPLAAVCFLLCIVIKDRGLVRQEEKQPSASSDENRENGAGELTTNDEEKQERAINT